MNPNFSKTIKSASEDVVLNAIEALKEAISNGNVEKPDAWLNKAIKEGWLPTEKHT